MNRRFNWKLALLGSFLAVILYGVGQVQENQRVWNPGAFTWWTLFGFAAVAAALIVSTIVGVMALTGDAEWTTPVAFVLGFGTGVGTLLFFQNVDVRWSDALVGIACFVVVGGLIIAIGYLAGRRR